MEGSPNFALSVQTASQSTSTVRGSYSAQLTHTVRHMIGLDEDLSAFYELVREGDHEPIRRPVRASGRRLGSRGCDVPPAAAKTSRAASFAGSAEHLSRMHVRPVELRIHPKASSAASVARACL